MLNKLFFNDFKINRKIAAASAVAGLIVSFFALDFGFEFEFVKEGMIWGLTIGIFWSVMKFYLHGKEGIMKSQRDLTSGIVYIALFLLGYFAGWAFLKLLALF